MNEKIKGIVEQYASESMKELEELLCTLGKIPAPTRQEEKKG